MVPRLCSCLLLFAAPGVAAEPGFEEINDACGTPLFADDNLWDDDAAALAGRLGWPRESETSLDSSYRLYPGASVRFLGARPYSQVLYGEQGRASALSLVFANKGDAVSASAEQADNRDLRQRRAEIRENRKAIEQDEKTLAAALTALFGEPVSARFGQGNRTRETVLRWDWHDHAFLLSAPRAEYVALRIMPSASADSGGKSRLPDAVIRERAASRVERRGNGDVVITDLPMVDQGPKGYCVPATWERVMRSMGIPADMYVLAMAGNTEAGGGTSGEDIMWGVRDAVTRAGRRLESPALKPVPSALAEYIDRGLPVMWGMFSTPEFNRAADGRLDARRGMTDPVAWSDSLGPAREAARDLRKDPEAAHLCLIIGYNARTGELAVSDSYGPGFEERWIASEEAAAVSQGRFYAIEF